MRRFIQLFRKPATPRRRTKPELKPEWLERRTLFSISPSSNEATEALLSHGGACACPVCAGWGNDAPAEVAGDPYYILAPPATAADADEPLYSLANLPQLNSLPGSQYTLHLDFDGHVEATWGSYSNAVTPAFDRDGNASTFSATEIETITEIWARVSEDFAPFNINVTTVDPGNFDNGRALKVAIGGHWSDWFGSSAGGVAYINSYTNWIANTVYVFPQALGNGHAKYVAEAASHEAGHGFGLLHQASYNGTTKTAEYNSGNSQWAPLMGVGYYAAASTWYDGPNSNSYNSFQDDMALISRGTNQFGYRADDHGSTSSAATQLNVSGNSISSAGIIGRNDDVDYFRFTTTGGQINIQASTIDVGANLDTILELRNSNNSVIASINPTNSRSASLSANLQAGDYYVVVRSTGVYGHIGQYTLSGNVPNNSGNNDPPGDNNDPPPNNANQTSTIGLYNAATGSFFLREANSSGPADAMFNFGPSGRNWVSLAGDWNGDGQSTIGLYDPSTGTFYLKNSNGTGVADLMFQFGPAGQNWTPLVGDWDQDGNDSIGLYNSSGGQFFLKNSNAGGAADLMFQFGPSGQNYKPLVGDWNGDGRTTIGVFDVARSSFFLNNANAGGAANHVFNFGPANANWKAITGDWNGDGTTGVGFYNNSAFFLKNSFAGGVADASFAFGPSNSTWTPLTGVWTTVASSPTPAVTSSQSLAAHVSTPFQHVASAVPLDPQSARTPTHSFALPSAIQPVSGLWDTFASATSSFLPRETIAPAPTHATSTAPLTPADAQLHTSPVDHLFATQLGSLLRGHG